jgi:hypothetical protein
MNATEPAASSAVLPAIPSEVLHEEERMAANGTGPTPWLERLQRLRLPRYAERRILAALLGRVEHQRPNLAAFFWKHLEQLDPSGYRDAELIDAALKRLETTDLTRGRYKEAGRTHELFVQSKMHESAFDLFQAGRIDEAGVLRWLENMWNEAGNRRPCPSKEILAAMRRRPRTCGIYVVAKLYGMGFETLRQRFKRAGYTGARYRATL